MDNFRRGLPTQTRTGAKTGVDVGLIENTHKN